MRTINKSRRKTYNTIMVVMVLIPVIFLGSFVGFFFAMIEDLKSFVIQTPDTGFFIPEDQIDMPTLRTFANNFEDRQRDYHIPYNMSQTCKINSTTGQIISYDNDDNGALHTGENLIASCFHYASLDDLTGKKQVLDDLIIPMFTAMKYMIVAPNGGLGPEYPGSMIARFYASPEMLQDGNYSWLMDPYFRHFNGTGEYSQWRVRLYTSKDEIAGFICALAAIQTLIDVPEIQETNNLMIAQMVEGFFDSFWQEISGDGKPNGANVNPPSEPQWRLALLKMAIKAYPDNVRYNQLYSHYLARESGIFSAASQMDMDIINNYYGLYFGANVIMALMLVEDDPDLIKVYFNNLEKNYKSFAGHRNAYFNVLYLAAYEICSQANPETTPAYDLANIVWDVKDQLWRFVEFDLFPYDDSYGNRNKTISRADKDPNGINWTIIDPNIAKWKDFVENNPLGSMYKPIIDILMDNILDTRYSMPSTVEMMPAQKILWNRNPFRYNGTFTREEENQTHEYASATFGLPYWMMTYYGYISEVNA